MANPTWTTDDSAFGRLAQYAQHPFQELVNKDIDPIQAYTDTIGIMFVHPEQLLRDPKHARARGAFFPPRQLLEHLDQYYVERLQEVLRPALAQCAKLAWYRAQDEELAEEICETWTPEALLALLSRPGAWAKDGLILEERRQHPPVAREREGLTWQRDDTRRAQSNNETLKTLRSSLGADDRKMDFEEDTVDSEQPDYMKVDVEDDTILSDSDDLVSIHADEPACDISAAGADLRRMSPRIELVLEDDEEEILNPANIQEVAPSPTTTLESLSPRAREPIDAPSVSPIVVSQEARGRAGIGSGHTPMNSIDDVLRMQQELLARSAEKKSDSSRHSARSTSGSSLGKRKDVPEVTHGLESPQKRSPSRGLQSDASMASPATIKDTVGPATPPSDSIANPISFPISVEGSALESSPALTIASLSAEQMVKSPKSADSTSGTSAESDPSSDLTSGPVLLTPPDDSSLDPLLNRMTLPEHLRDATAEDIEAILQAGGILQPSSTPASKASSSTLTSISEPMDIHDLADADTNNWGSPKQPRRGSNKFPPKLVPHTLINSIPYIPPLPASALGPKTINIIRQLWWDVRAELRVCKCTVCKRSREYGDDEEDEVDEDLQVVDPRWSIPKDKAKRMRLS